MARPGPAPTRRTEGRSDVADWISVADVPYVAGRERPCPVPTPTAATEKWWDTIREMPHAILWSEADWRFAEDLCSIKDRFYLGELNDSALSEMRRREDHIGTTFEARRKVRIKYVAQAVSAASYTSPSAAPAADGSNVTSISGRRTRLLEE